MDTIDRYVAEHRSRFLDELRALLRFPSVSAQPQHDADTRACAQWVADHLADLGCDVRQVDKGGQPIVVARYGDPAGPTVVIYGHYDVQPEDPRDQWHSDPFEPVERDGRLYARGTTDDKGQVFAHIKALETLVRTETPLPCSLTFVLEGEEESGGDSLARYVREDAATLSPLAVIISDGTMLDPETPALNYGLRGIIAFEFTVYGPSQDVHSGSYGGAIANPAVALAHILAACVDRDGRVLVPGFYNDVLPLTDWERDNLARVPFDPQTILAETGAPALHGEPGRGVLERIWARPTFEVNGIYGGYAGDRSKTIIPASATAKISLRLVPGQDPETIARRTLDHIRAVSPASVRLETSDYAAAAPVLIDTDHPVLRSAAEALRHGFGRDPVFTRCGGSIPVVNTFGEQWGCPVVLMGLGQDSDGPHSPNEHFAIDSFLRGIKASSHLFAHFPKSPH